MTVFPNSQSNGTIKTEGKVSKKLPKIHIFLVDASSLFKKRNLFLYESRFEASLSLLKNPCFTLPPF